MIGIYQLYRLQQADSKIGVLEHQLATLAPSEEHAKTVRVRERKVKEADAALHALKTQLKDSELKTASIEDHRKQIEKKLYDGKTTNPKELAGFQQEAEMLRSQQDKLDEQSLELMDRVAAQEAELANLKDRLDRGRRALDEEHKKLEQSRVDLQQQLADLKQKRDALAAELDAVMLGRYDNLRKRKSGVAVARLSGSACGQCGVTVPEPVRKRVEHRELETCPSCERLLFAETAAAH